MTKTELRILAVVCLAICVAVIATWILNSPVPVGWTWNPPQSTEKMKLPDEVLYFIDIVLLACFSFWAALRTDWAKFGENLILAIKYIGATILVLSIFAVMVMVMFVIGGMLPPVAPTTVIIILLIMIWITLINQQR
jgi:hypothetical protein